MTTSSIPRKFEGGDHRSIGWSNEVVVQALASPELFGAVFACLSVNDPLIRARVAGAVEKISVIHPEYLRPYRARLVGEYACREQKEVRWPVAQMLPRLAGTHANTNRCMTSSQIICATPAAS